MLAAVFRHAPPFDALHGVPLDKQLFSSQTSIQFTETDATGQAIAKAACRYGFGFAL
jgi:hypothetical protein